MLSATSRLLLPGIVALALIPAPAPALLNVGGTRNQVFVFGGVGLTYSTNIFSDATERGDTSASLSGGVELQRRAGLIAINASARFEYLRYQEFTDENAFNPSLMVIFEKSTGRTTGSLSLSAYRESRSDSAVNLRTNSWNYPFALNLKYPINEKFYLTSQTAYLRREYEDHNAGLVNYADVSESLDLFYVYTSKLDLSGGYRLRFSQTDTTGDTYDHWFNLGATGGLFAKLSGTVRVGYQVRQEGTGDSFDQFNAMGALTWPLTRKLSLSGQLSRDFNTIATGSTVDSTSIALSASYALRQKLEFTAGVGYGRNRFLDDASDARHDDFVSFDLGARYRMNEHFEAGAAYSWFRNASTSEFSDFDRQMVTVNVSSRY